MSSSKHTSISTYFIKCFHSNCLLDSRIRFLTHLKAHQDRRVMASNTQRSLFPIGHFMRIYTYNSKSTGRMQVVWCPRHALQSFFGQHCRAYSASPYTSLVPRLYPPPKSLGTSPARKHANIAVCWATTHDNNIHVP